LESPGGILNEYIRISEKTKNNQDILQKDIPIHELCKVLENMNIFIVLLLNIQEHKQSIDFFSLLVPFIYIFGRVKKLFRAFKFKAK